MYTFKLKIHTLGIIFLRFSEVCLSSKISEFLYFIIPMGTTPPSGIDDLCVLTFWSYFCQRVLDYLATKNILALIVPDECCSRNALFIFIVLFPPSPKCLCYIFYQFRSLPASTLRSATTERVYRARI